MENFRWESFANDDGNLLVSAKLNSSSAAIIKTTPTRSNRFNISTADFQPGEVAGDLARTARGMSNHPKIALTQAMHARKRKIHRQCARDKTPPLRRKICQKAV